MEPRLVQIRPHTPFDAQFPLSQVDLQLPPRFVREAFIYEADPEVSCSSAQGQDLVSRLQESLKSLVAPLNSETVSYPQLLGKIVRQPGERPFVKVDTSSFIPFNVVDRSDFDFAQLHRNGKFPMEAINLPDFKIGLDAKELLQTPGGPPMSAIQLTFVRGGIVLVVVVSHSLSDGYGIAGFLRRWFQAARAALGINGQNGHKQDDTSSTLAIHDKSQLIKIDVKGETPGLRKAKELYNGPPAQTSAFMGTVPIISQIFWMPPENVQKMRADVGAHSSKPPSVFAAMMTILWRAIIRSRQNLQTDSPELINGLITCDMRRRLDPPLPYDYFGNAITGIWHSLPKSEVAAAGSTSEVIKAIQETLENDATGQNLLLSSRFFGDQMAKGIFPPLEFISRDIVFNTWEHLFASVADLDLGCGEFCAVRYLMDTPPSPGYVLLLPSFGRRLKRPDKERLCQYPGGLEFQIHLTPEQMELVEKDEEWTQYATPIKA